MTSLLTRDQPRLHHVHAKFTISIDLMSGKYELRRANTFPQETKQSSIPRPPASGPPILAPGSSRKVTLLDDFIFYPVNISCNVKKNKLLLFSIVIGKYLLDVMAETKWRPWVSQGEFQMVFGLKVFVDLPSIYVVDLFKSCQPETVFHIFVIFSVQNWTF